MAKKSKRPLVAATFELVTDAGFSWSFAPSDIEFCGDEALIASVHSYDTMNVRRWRVSDGAVTLDRSFALARAQLDRRAVFLQWIGDFAGAGPARNRAELLWRDHLGEPALLDPDTLEVSRALPKSEANHVMAFAAYGAIVYVEDGAVVRVFDLETLEERARYEFEFGAAMVSVSTGGRHIVVVEKSGRSKALSLEDGSVIELPTDGQQAGVTLLDRRRLALFCSYQRDRAVCARSLDQEPPVDVACATFVGRTAAARDESLWVAYGLSRAIYGFDCATRSLRWATTLDSATESAVFSASGRWIAAATQHRVALIDAQTGALHPAYGPAHPPAKIELGDGFVLATPADHERSAPHVWTWDTNNPSEKARATMLAAGAATLVGDKIARVDSGAYSLSALDELLAEPRLTPAQAKLIEHPNERFVIDANSALYRGTSKFVARKYVHGVERCTRESDGTWRRVSIGNPQKKRATALCVLEAQRQLVVGWDSRELTFIDIETGEQLRALSKLKRPAQRIIATRDGSALALALGGYLLAFVHGASVTVTARSTAGFAWTPDDRWLLSVNYEWVDRFDAKTGEHRATAKLDLNISAIAVARDGAVYVGALDSNVYRLRLPESFWID